MSSLSRLAGLPASVGEFLGSGDTNFLPLHIIIGDQHVRNELIMSSTAYQLTLFGIISHVLVSMMLFFYFFSCNPILLFLLLAFYQPLLSLPWCGL